MVTPRKTRARRQLSPFAQRLRYLRQKLGRSQVEVADELGISRSYLAALETDADAPGRETLQALAIFYGVSLDYLYAVLPRPSGPEQVEFVKSPSELALLRFWRNRSLIERRVLVGLLHLPPDLLEGDDDTAA